MSDPRWMRRCLALARRAAGRTSPNPLVGSVVLDRGGRVVGEGFHRGVGTLHAERVALLEAGAKAKGGTIYTNLEPCHHRDGGRTPCSGEIAKAGIARVVYGANDPIGAHAGGARWLRRKGVQVDGPVLEEECRLLNAAFFTWATLGRTHVIAKVACSLDGRIATASGQSQWITGERARADGHRMRAVCDAIVVGIGTVLADDPQLSCRGVRGALDPVRVVLDSRLRTPVTSKLLPANSDAKARAIIVGRSDAPAKRQANLEAAGAEVWRIGKGKQVSVVGVLRRLGKEGLTSALVEGGAKLHTALVKGGLVDEMVVYVAPTALGGPRGWFLDDGRGSLAKAPRLVLAGKPKVLGGDVRLTYRRSVG